MAKMEVYFGYQDRAVLRAFRAALKAVAAKRTLERRLGLFDAAMAAGQPMLGGFAPAAGGIGGPAGRQKKTGSGALAGEARPAVPGPFDGPGQAGILTASRRMGEAPSYRTILAQTHAQAAGGRARREAERAVLAVPSRGAMLAEISFAPPPDVGAAGGAPLYPAMRRNNAMPVLRRRGSVHDAVVATEAANVDQGQAESEALPATPISERAPMLPFDFERALDDYFFQQSRLAPAGSAGFNPRLTPQWAGLKIPG